MFKQRNHTLTNFRKVCQNFHRTKAKLQNDTLIRPTSGEFKCIDYKFETDEEIETQNECQTIQSKANFQKINNSFANLNINIEINEGKSNKKNKLKFFHCDSITIRPSCHQVIQKQIKLEKLNKKLAYDSDVSTGQKGNQILNRVSTLDKNYQIRSLRSSRQRKKIAIFEKKVNQGPSFPNTIPKALLPYDIKKHQQRIQRMTQKELYQQHIIFQTDQITQCCL